MTQWRRLTALIKLNWAKPPQATEETNLEDWTYLEPDSWNGEKSSVEREWNTKWHSFATWFERQIISDKNGNLFFESTHNSKLENGVLQWAGYTIENNVDSVYVFW